MSGAGCRRSEATKPARSTAEPTKMPMVCARAPASGRRSARARRRAATRPPVTSTAPRRSNARALLDAALVAGARRQRRIAARPDRHVDEEDPLPVELVGEDAAEQHARRAAEPATAPQTPRAMLRSRALGEGRRQDRERGRRDDRRAEALDRPAAMSDASDDARPADQRGRPRRATRPAMNSRRRPSRSASAAAEQQEAAEGQRVGADRPTAGWSSREAESRSGSREARR